MRPGAVASVAVGAKLLALATFHRVDASSERCFGMSKITCLPSSWSSTTATRVCRLTIVRDALSDQRPSVARPEEVFAISIQLIPFGFCKRKLYLVRMMPLGGFLFGLGGIDFMSLSAGSAAGHKCYNPLDVMHRNRESVSSRFKRIQDCQRLIGTWGHQPVALRLPEPGISLAKSWS